MSKLDDVNYICYFLGIDVKNNDFIALDLAEIKNKKEFIEFIKKHDNHVSLTYKNPLQKLNKLKAMFNEHANKDRLEKATTQAQILANKVKEIMYAVEKQPCEMDKHELIHVRKNGELEQYYTNFKSGILNSIGDVRYVIRCYKYGDLVEKIEDEFKKVILKTTEAKQLKSPVEKVGIAYKEF